MSSIRDTLAAEAVEAEARRDEPPARVHRARVGGGAGQVYTVRMPAERLAEPREIARLSGEQPSALTRRWVLERMDTERSYRPDLADVRRTLTDALRALGQIGGKRPA